jgi:(p)ppGpp synthase/HD superfamily hydrolase
MTNLNQWIQQSLPKDISSLITAKKKDQEKYIEELVMRFKNALEDESIPHHVLLDWFRKIFTSVKKPKATNLD